LLYSPACTPGHNSAAADPPFADRGDTTLCNANICGVFWNSFIHLMNEEQPLKKKTRSRRTTGKKIQEEQGRRVRILSSLKKSQQTH
jgi:hypothetical protein